MSSRILVGDVRERLAELPDNSIQCVVTSPPYFGLRDYGTSVWEGGVPGCDHEGKAGTRYEPGCEAQAVTICHRCGAFKRDRQIGLEATLADYLDTLVAVFREVRRVLRPDGTCWVNIGDSYAANRSYQVTDNKHKDVGNNGAMAVPDGLKPKDLMLVPFRLALALQADGWWVRSSIIWAKRAPMPESVTDRPTSAHEHVFLLTKQSRYFYDADAVREPYNEGSLSRYDSPLQQVVNGANQPGGDPTRRESGKTMMQPNPMGRNQRDVWLLSPEPFPEAHFATFPTEIPRRCIRAGTSEKGACSACGAPWVRQTKTDYDNPGNRTTNGPRSVENRAFTAGFEVRLEKRVETTGWAPSCACFGTWQAITEPNPLYRDGDEWVPETITRRVYVPGPDDPPPVPCKVLDPFLGSGTTLLVADQLGRDGIGVELNPEYARMAERRITGDAPMFANVERVA